MSFRVVGAGMAGLLAAAILREECEEIIEQQKSLPNNHHSLLRFRSAAVADALNIPFRQVSVIKAVVPWAGNVLGDSIAYAIKTTGTATLRSIHTVGGEIEQRYIAPPDLIERMRKKVTAPINFDTKLGYIGDLPVRKPTISTIPMPILAKILGYENLPEPTYMGGWSILCPMKNTHVCGTLYFPNPELIHNRVSITDDQLIVEITDSSTQDIQSQITEFERSPRDLQKYLTGILAHFGIVGTRDYLAGMPVIKRQSYAKILSMNDDARKRFMLWATEKFNVYSFGRFATWRPSLLLDDLVNGLRVIQKISRGTNYEGRK